MATLTKDDTHRFKMPTVTVTARKEPEDRQKVSVSDITALLAAPIGVERLDSLAPAPLSELQPVERRRRAARCAPRRIPRLAAEAAAYGKTETFFR